MNVDFVPVPPSVGQGTPVGERLGGKRFVEFNQVDLRQRPADLVEQARDSFGRRIEDMFGLERGLRIPDNPRHRLPAEGFGFGPAGHHQRCRRVIEAGSVTRRHATLRIKSRLELAEGFPRGIPAGAFIDCHLRHLTFAARDGDGNDLCVELARIDGRNRLPMARQRIVIHRLTGNAKSIGDEFGGVAHRPIFKSTPEPIDHERIAEPGIPVAELPHAGIDEVGRLAHAFDAAHDKQRAVARSDSLRRQHNGFEARPADFVDRAGSDRAGQSSSDRNLPGNILAQARRNHIAYVHFVDIREIGQRGALYRSPHDGSAQFRRRHPAQGALQTPDRGACGA